MKCPKCGFNSFEYYDQCKKCSGDLTGYKQTHSIVSLVLPQEAKDTLAAGFRRDENLPERSADTVDIHDNIFAFDLPDDSSTTPARNNDAPFNFDERSPGMNQSGSPMPEGNPFADLLESTSQTEESPFTAAPATATPAPTATTGAVSASEPGEFDLASFCWDETPAAKAATAGNELDDEFDSLFGTTKENTSG